MIGQQAHGAASCLNVIIQNSPVCPLVACVVIKDIASHECGGQSNLCGLLRVVTVSNLICVASWYVCISVVHEYVLHVYVH